MTDGTMWRFKLNYILDSVLGSNDSDARGPPKQRCCVFINDYKPWCGEVVVALLTSINSCEERVDGIIERTPINY